MSARKRILFVVNQPKFFLTHRLPLAIAAQEAGLEVHIATAQGASLDVLEATGFPVHVIPLTRSSLVPHQEVGSIMALVSLYRMLKPDLVPFYTEPWRPG